MMNMKRVSILNELVENGVVAVVRGDSAATSLQTSQAIVEGGIKVLEITFTIPGAEKVITQLNEQYAKQNILIGAGTILDPVTARIAIMSGASYIVSPTFNKETDKLCNLYHVPYLPGCMSINEIQEALTYGVDIIKMFPGNVYGPDFIKTVKGPLPHVNVMPSGGVDQHNIKDWINAGAVAVSVGSNLTKGAKNGDFQEVTELATAYQHVYMHAKGGE